MSNKVDTNFGGSVMALIAVVVLVLVINALVGMMHKSAPVDMSDAAVAERIGPVAQLNTGAPMAPPAPAAAAAPAAARSGEAVYKSACFACHDTGAAGAPMLGNNDAWSSRVAQGFDVLLQHSIDGFQGSTGFMPARGTCGNCSDEELAKAVQYMLDAL